MMLFLGINQCIGGGCDYRVEHASLSLEKIKTIPSINFLKEELGEKW